MARSSICYMIETVNCKACDSRHGLIQELRLKTKHSAMAYTKKKPYTHLWYRCNSVARTQTQRRPVVGKKSNARRWGWKGVLRRARGGGSCAWPIWCSPRSWRALVLCTLNGADVKPGPDHHLWVDYMIAFLYVYCNFKTESQVYWENLVVTCTIFFYLLVFSISFLQTTTS